MVKTNTVLLASMRAVHFSFASSSAISLRDVASEIKTTLRQSAVMRDQNTHVNHQVLKHAEVF